MIKDRYSLVGLLILFFSASVSAGLQLRVKGGLQGKAEDTHEPVMVLAQGDEYVVQVVSDTECGESLTINGVENAAAFEVARGGTSNSMTIINGRTTSTVTYNYTVRPMVLGSYIMGPAIVDSSTGHEVSNTVNVRVVEPAAYDRFAGKKGAARQALQCRLEVEAHEVYVGQPLRLTVVIEDDGNVLERGLQPPHFGVLKAEPIGKAGSEQKMVNGQLKVVTQQEYTVTADAPGTYTIDPATAHFMVPEEERDPFSGGFFGNFFGPSGKKRSVRSNSMIIGVKPLPLSNEPVDGVGVFSGIALKANKQVLELNEPCTVTFSVTGTGNFDAITAPVLNCSDELTIYPSTSSCGAAAQKGLMTKTFEYIVQVGAAGQHEIPPQSFSFFDTQAGAYKTLRTEPLLLQVKPAKQQAVKVPVSLLGEENKKEVLPVTQSSSVPVLPWWVFVFVGLFLLVVIFRDLARTGWYYTGELLGITSRVKREKAALRAIIEKQEVATLHSFFVTLLATAWQCDTQVIDPDFVYGQVTQWGWDYDRAAAFALYIEKCSQAAFASQTIKEATKTELLDKAVYWYELVSGEIKGEKR